ncbi:hypothetical protein C8C94_4869 [Acidovorax sp. 94]|jgi:hypothetical protein|uniref:hypothetical protein n=1 Tax=unclassified Acidovorax TaxID=2684926 RepID=UPI000EB13753|nr:MULTISPECIES: hypothetical protein [unclassified Acidovorax]MBV7458790.1 hypothetical protein [Acidovorax sp. sif0632]MBV7463388.1 hypothetical protein [Acidovorax sp. sif0613]RKR70322.1 hypothetical protein C8C94_4869 [Acidovorax sp. 94]
MSGIAFITRQHEAGSLRVRESSAKLPDGGHLSIAATRSTRLVDLYMSRDFMSVHLEFSIDQARAVAAELLAGADALQGRG